MSDRARATFARTLATALLLAAAAAAQDVVTARLRWESGYVRKTHSHVVKSGAEPPKVGPSGLTGGTYGTLPLLGRKVLVAFGDGRFWVDSDADGSFEGERPFYTEGTSWELVRTVVVDDEPIVLRFYSSGLFLRYSPRSYRVGTVVLAGRLRRIALSDHDGDLLFTAKDHLYVDVDGDGELDEIKPGRPVRMGDRGFVASIADPRGGAVEFAKAPAPPPPAPRKWVPLSMWRRSRRASKPSETLAELKRSYAALDSQQFTGRYDLVDKVGRVQSDEAFRFLWKIAHDDPEEYVRGYAVKAMRYEAYRSHRKKIRTLLKSRDPEIVAAALEVLDDPDDAEQEALFLKFVRNKDATIVRAAAHALAARRTDAGRAALVRVFERAGDGSLRYEAYDHLRYWREGPPVELALRAATDSYDRLRAAALEDLWKLDHPDTHKLALEAAEGTPSTTERYTIIDVLKRFDDRKSIHAVIAMARSSGAEVRKRVLEALRPLRSPGALAELVAALRDKDPAVRALAAEVLAGVDDADAEITKALARQAKREKDEAARDTLLGALGDQGDPSTIPLLLKLAKRKNIAAIRALARFGLGEPRVRAYFLGLLESRKWENRVYALDAAGLSGQESLVNRVAANLDHGVWQVRLAAVEALGKLRFKASIPPLIERLGPEEHKRVRARRWRRARPSRRSSGCRWAPAESCSSSTSRARCRPSTRSRTRAASRWPSPRCSPRSGGSRTATRSASSSSTPARCRGRRSW